MGASERKKELRRRRKRHAKVLHLKKKLGSATESEKHEIARKLREMTPGAEQIINAWELQKADR